MPIFEQFAVVVVPFPFTEQNANKRRPVLVLSNQLFNTSAEHSVLAMITSAKSSNWPQDVIISDLANAGLTTASIVRMKLFILDNRLIIRQAGSLTHSDRVAVINSLSNCLDLSN